MIFLGHSDISNLYELIVYYYHSLYLDIHDSLANVIRITPKEIQSTDLDCRRVQISDECCNDIEYTTFDFSRFYNVEEIIIGNDCFENVDIFVVNELNTLKSLKIGDRSFSKIKSVGDWDYERVKNDCMYRFQISNCNELESIEIGRFSFVSFNDNFILRNLPKLVTIKIGSIESDISESNNRGWSANFAFASFVVEGMIGIDSVIIRPS